jgi:hypothetical protein
MTRRAIAPTPPVQPDTAANLSAELDALAKLAGSLVVNWADPWRYYELRSELKVRLHQAARRVAVLEQREATQRKPCPVCDQVIGHRWNCSLNAQREAGAR